MSSGYRVFYCFALFALVQQIYAATTYNLNASDTTEVYVSESVTVVFPPTKGAFAQVAVANASLPSYQDPTASAPGLFANVTIFIAVYDSKTRLTTQPPSPIYVKIFGEELTADHQLYIWNSVVQKWYPAAETCSNGTLSFANDTLSVPVCHVGQLALFDMRTETDGGGALLDPTSSDKPSKAGVIAAAVIVPIVVVIIVIVLVYMFMVRYRQRSKSNADLEKAPRITPQLTTTVVKTHDEEEVDSYSSNSSASSVSSYSHSEGEKQEDKPPVIVVESTPQVQEPIKNEEPKPTNTEEKPEEDEKDETSSASSSSSSSSSSDSDSDSSSSESD